jgi:hypothetical protein
MGFVYTLSLLYQIAHVGLKEKPYPRAGAGCRLLESARVAHTFRRFEGVKEPKQLTPRRQVAKKRKVEVLVFLCDICDLCVLCGFV